MYNRDKFEALFAVWFVICAIVSLAFTGVLIWALIELIQWINGQ